MTEERSKLVIIGNGFDLAHGFKTSYNDFMLWYLSNCIKRCFSGNGYKDLLINITVNNELDFVDIEKNPLNSINDCRKFFSKYKIEYNTSRFLQRLLESHKQYNWVDIENEYYNSVVGYYDNVKHNSSRMDWVPELRKLNEQFEFLRDKLEEYLIEIQQNIIKDHKPNANGKITKIIQDIFSKLSASYKSYVTIPTRGVLLNFNYTNTIEKYMNSYYSSPELIYIHGQLNDKDNPIIFGFGDETDEYYEKIENLKINDFLNNFKSFWYFKTNNYQKLLKFIDEQQYDIEILGHSCGLSDRVLLSTIFQHDNCKSIKIHYYAKSETENDHFVKTQEISRHFRDKAKMRERIVDFTECDSIN